jgi:hypothetical protein
LSAFFKAGGGTSELLELAGAAFGEMACGNWSAANNIVYCTATGYPKDVFWAGR